MRGKSKISDLNMLANIAKQEKEMEGEGDYNRGIQKKFVQNADPLPQAPNLALALS